MRFSWALLVWATTVLAMSPLAGARTEVYEGDAGEAYESDLGAFDAFLSEAHSWGTITFTAGPDYVLVNWDGIELGSQASQEVRRIADGLFSDDPDGIVDRAERDNLVFGLSMAARQAAQALAADGPADGGFFIDDTLPQGADVTELATSGLIGPVDQDAVLGVALSLRVSFPDVDEDRRQHEYRLDLGSFALPADHDEEAERVAGDLRVVVQAAKHWSIDASSIAPECAAANFHDGKLVFSGKDVSCFTGHEGALLAFKISGTGLAHYLPATAGLGVALAAAASGALVRRRL